MKIVERRLTAAFVKTAPAGRHCDGGGLYLQVTPTDGGFCRSWLFCYRKKYRNGKPGKLRSMGLGSVRPVNLADAREKARKLRLQRLDGIDPLDEKRKALQLEMTFDEIATTYLDAHKVEWQNTRHRAQWEESLKQYASPILGKLAVGDINSAAVLRCLKPIWTTKPETASRLRGRIESVLDLAGSLDLRQGPNPARWKGCLEHALPKLKSTKKARYAVTGRKEHHPALDYRLIGAFMVNELRVRTSTVARALEFTILTAARTDEVLGVTWNEFDLAEAVWTVPEERMKSGREHKVPLSPRALEIVKAQLAVRTNDYVFPGGSNGRIAPIGMRQLLVLRMKHLELTVHGFRATFRTWCAEQTGYPRELAEVALAHRVGDDTENAYQRGDLLEKRRRLMTDWADFVNRTESVNNGVVPIRAMS